MNLEIPETAHRTVRVGIVEDQVWMLRGLVATFECPPETQIHWTARTIAEAEARFAESVPDVILMDHRLDGQPVGVDLAAGWVRRYPASRILILTAHEEPEIWQRARNAGLAGFLIKKATDDSLMQAVLTVARGGTWFDHPLLPWGLLTPAELAVVDVLSVHGSAKIAAAALVPPVSVRTVESHLQNIYRKLGIRNIKELIRRYRMEKKA